MTALSTQTMLERNSAGVNVALRRLATGKKLQSGADGPAELISAERLQAEIRALESYEKTLRRADSNAAIAEAHAGQVSDMVVELHGLVVSSANEAGMTDAEVQANQAQIDALSSSIRRATSDAVTSLDRVSLPDSGTAQAQQTLSDTATSVASLASGGANSLASGDFAAATAVIDSAVQSVATIRGDIGSYQRYTVQPGIRSAQVGIENLTEARSILVDTDYAAEMANYNRFSTLRTSDIKTLKIAQQQSSTVLELLR
ncbi:MAG: hypothetical protein KJ749_07470 [Planctomycetes bacterium]|nr:hypothetical protein [Planctomycetota bacterium]